jgi:hypothetical protein
MAQKRMIDRRISVSEQIGNLTIPQMLIFTWSIPHSDDVGLLPFSTKTLKATIIPLIDMSYEEFDVCWKAIVEQKLVEFFEYDEQKFWRIKTFLKNQTLKRDRQPLTILKFTYSPSAIDSWEKLIKILHLEDIGFQMENIGNQIYPEEKLSKEKLREDKSIYGDKRFQFFWKEYPKKAGKGDAWRAWKKLNPNDDIARSIIISVREHSKTTQWRKENGQYIPNPATFINGRRFDDTPGETALSTGGKSNKFDGIGKKIKS